MKLSNLKTVVYVGLALFYLYIIAMNVFRNVEGMTTTIETIDKSKEALGPADEEEKTADAKSSDSKSSDSKTSDSKSSDAKTSDSKSSDSKTADSKSSDSKSSDSKSSDAKTSDATDDKKTKAESKTKP